MLQKDLDCTQLSLTNETVHALKFEYFSTFSKLYTELYQMIPFIYSDVEVL